MKSKKIREGLFGGLLGVISVIPFLFSMSKILDKIALLDIFWIIIILILSFVVIIFIHELGHLVMGLLTGYKFVSFRMFRLHIQKEEGKYKIYNKGIPGTLGQCLMLPPKGKEVPIFWYNFGGVLFNLITALISIIVIFTSSSYWVLVTANIMFTLSLILGISNWMIADGVPNDGANYKSCKKYPESRLSFYYVTYINALLTQGKRLTEIDLSELSNIDFKVSEAVQLNALTFVSSQKQFLNDLEGYKNLMAKAHEETKGKVGIIDNIINTEYYFMMLVNDYESSHLYKTKEVTMIMQQMKNELAIQMFGLYEKYKKTGILDEVSYQKFLENCKYSDQKGLGADLLDYSKVLFDIEDESKFSKNRKVKEN